MIETELRAEIVRLKAEIIRLKGRAVEDRHFSEERLLLEVQRAQSPDREGLKQQISDLQRIVEEEGAIIDRIVVYLTKDLGG